MQSIGQQVSESNVNHSSTGSSNAYMGFHQSNRENLESSETKNIIKKVESKQGNACVVQIFYNLGEE